MDINADKTNRVTEDVSYLVDELKALKFVIDSVPVHDKPPGSQSIYEMFALIDHAQVSYYGPLLNKLLGGGVSDFKTQDFKNTFDSGHTDDKSVSHLLSEIMANRINILDKLGKLDSGAWVAACKINSRDYSVLSLMEEMVEFERNQLREIAERVLSMESKTPEK